MDRNKLLVNLGKAIKVRRNELSLTQKKLAEMSDLHKNYIGMVERGERNITISNLVKLTIALNTTTDSLLSSFLNDE